MSEYVYIFNAMDLYKIGRSTDVGRRLADYASYPIPIFFVFSVEVDDSRAIEASIHRDYHQYRVNGEWFRLSDICLEEIKCRLMKAGVSYVPPRLSSIVARPKVSKVIPNNKIAPVASEMTTLLNNEVNQTITNLLGASDRAKRLRARRGSFGWELVRGWWVFTPDEVEELRPGKPGRPKGE